MRDFIYHHAASLEEARRLAVEPGAMLLAGGQTLLRDMKRGRHSPASLVDIGRILSRQIALHDDAIVIGAGATHGEVAGSSALQQHLPVLAALVDHIGDPAVRHRGTLGGALAANEPAGDYPAACLALGTTVHTTARKIAAADFFAGDGRSVLEPGEIITAATFPIPGRAAYVKFLNPAARYAMVGVFASCAVDGRPAVAVTGASACGAFRWQEAETALIDGFAPENLRGIRLSQESLAEDLFADAAYRSHLAGVLARRAVALASDQSSGVVVQSHGSRLTDVASIHSLRV
jgi:aerobic carbon-monoxide dehydrogenase medium subunit